MLKLSKLSPNSINQILQSLEDDGKISASLPGGGLLHIEEDLPYLLVYRKRKNDEGTSRIVLSEASYLLIGDKDFEDYQKLVFYLAEKLASRFKSYMLFEIYTGEDRQRFTIKAPAEKLPTTLEVLQKDLNNINNVFSGIYLNSEIKDTPHRQKEGDKDLLTIVEAKQSGAVLVGLEIPPIFRDTDEKVYPVFLRKFKDYLVTSIHKSIYDYIRVQTTCGVASYQALGRKYLKEKVFEIDKALSKIENSYQFLWLVSPSNIQEIKNTFFESDYEKVLDYHYRLLPIDPDLLKRELYNLKIEEIDDPAMSHIFREKREELDQQITMLNERGTSNFFYNSIRLYKGLSPELSQEAGKILREIPETEENKDTEYLDAKAFSSLARKEFDYFAEQNPDFKSKVHIREDVNIIMVSNGELYVPADYRTTKTEANALIQHEVGTHVLTHFNGSRQPLQLLSSGLADYDPLQEGLAVMSEYMVDGLTGNRLRTLAGRVIAGSALMEGAEFPQLFRLLKMEYGFSAERAFNITSRIMQGGGFLKDIIYLKGLVHLRTHLQNGGEYEPLMAGKFGLKHIDIIRELTERKVLEPAALRPSFLLTKNITNKLNLIREGLPLSQMITQ
ncbi:conserved hypothetical protein [Salegentibacter echinorum]|uniref:DUF1704 domain-containing protein n=1 Tax=Salegentibacter echinorum TaxID=1073325 RepID=A0A1M5JLC0_SALEC|nr:tyrosine/phenylalanine carboxypeptidase domain-containing protein [Salegentibacter echinorum]SHG41318.1 conserved hypothetical protein [Salegentibacter echinorum]